MYQIKCTTDGIDYILFDLRDDDLTVSNPKLKLETNKVGELAFTIYDTHPYFDKVKKLKSIIRVYQFKTSPSIDGKIIFKGRVIEDEQDFDNAKYIECESKLAMLIDSQTPPFNLVSGTLTSGGQTAYTGDASPQRFFKWVIDTHNEQVEDFQKFELDDTQISQSYTINGETVTKTVPKYCTVIDPNDTIIRSNANYATTYSTIEDKFISLLGGYINVKYDVEKNGELVDYIEYVDDFRKIATQQIELGENLLDISQVVSGAEVATVLIPLGKRAEGSESEGESQSELTIKDIANGEYNDLGVAETGGDIVKSGDRIYSKRFVAEYGKIVKTETWEDITEAQNLFKKAISKLKGESIYLSATITLKAVDLAILNKDIESFYWQDKIRVFSRPHGITGDNVNEGATYLLEKIDIALSDPQQTEIVLGKTWKTITDVTLGVGKAQSTINKIEANYATNESVKSIATVAATEAVEGEVEAAVGEAVETAIGGDIDTVVESILTNSSTISQTAEEIVLEVVKGYVEKEGYEEYKEELSAQLKVLADELVIKFDKTVSDVETVDGNVQAQFQEITKYIRFVDGKIILGQEGNEITLELSNNRLSFLQNNLEVAYMSNNKLFVVNSEFVQNLKIGNFSFTPRSNGNLSLNLSTATTPDMEDNDDGTI